MDVGVFLGRMCPIHLGHQHVIEKMRLDYGRDYLIILGSSNEIITHRNIFSYRQRTSYIRMVYGETARLIGLGDHGGRNFLDDLAEWLAELKDTIKLAFYGQDVHPIFYSGSEFDISFFVNNDMRFKIVNRTGPGSYDVAGEDIRKHLLREEHDQLGGLLDPRIIPHVLTDFEQNLKILLSM